MHKCATAGDHRPPLHGLGGPSDKEDPGMAVLQNCIIKLGDFGIAKVLDSTIDLAKTQIGTPFYMSPEVFKNSNYSYKSDIWGIGCVLYELICGKHAFGAQSLNGLAVKVLRGKYAPLLDYM